MKVSIRNGVAHITGSPNPERLAVWLRRRFWVGAAHGRTMVIHAKHTNRPRTWDELRRDVKEWPGRKVRAILQKARR